jgi:hypothetical protein
MSKQSAAPGYKFSQEEMQAALKKVCDRDDWKRPIDAIIPVADSQLVEEAIAFFGCGEMSFYSGWDGEIRITAPGYYATMDG